MGCQMRLSTRDAIRATSLPSGHPPEWATEVSSRLIVLGEGGRAATLIDRLMQCETLNSKVLFDLARQLASLDQHGVALAVLDRIESGSGTTFASAFLRGNALRYLGQMDAAEQCLEQCIALNPTFTHAYRALAQSGSQEGAARRAERIRALLAKTALPDSERCYLDYALFRELELLGEWDAAWAALKRGFDAKRRSIQHDAIRETALFDGIIKAFPNAAARVTTPVDAVTPIFIVGMPRTGTTLLERILGNCPQIRLCGELNDLRMQYKWVADHYCPGFFDAKSLDLAESVDYDLLGKRYLDHVRWRTEGARHFTDKNPGNFQMAGALLKALPQAKIIHLIRDPIDACFSNLKELFAASAFSYSYDFAELAAHHRNYQRLMAHWHAIAPGRILDVRYEDLVCAPEAQTERVMHYLDLPYTPGQSRIEANTQSVSTASSAQVREPIHRRNIGGWQRYAQQLQPLIDALGAA